MTNIKITELNNSILDSNMLFVVAAGNNNYKISYGLMSSDTSSAIKTTANTLLANDNSISSSLCSSVLALVKEISNSLSSALTAKIDGIDNLVTSIVNYYNNLSGKIETYTFIQQLSTGLSNAITANASKISSISDDISNYTFIQQLSTGLSNAISSISDDISNYTFIQQLSTGLSNAISSISDDISNYAFIQQLSTGLSNAITANASKINSISDDISNYAFIQQLSTGLSNAISSNSIPAATVTALGGIRVGYTYNDKVSPNLYPVSVDNSNNAFTSVDVQKAVNDALPSDIADLTSNLESISSKIDNISCIATIVPYDLYVINSMYVYAIILVNDAAYVFSTDSKLENVDIIDVDEFHYDTLLTSCYYIKDNAKTVLDDTYKGKVFFSHLNRRYYRIVDIDEVCTCIDVIHIKYSSTALSDSSISSERGLALRCKILELLLSDARSCIDDLLASLQNTAAMTMTSTLTLDINIDNASALASADVSCNAAVGGYYLARAMSASIDNSPASSASDVKISDIYAYGNDVHVLLSFSNSISHIAGKLQITSLYLKA